jgi:PKD repeat protein
VAPTFEPGGTGHVSVHDEFNRSITFEDPGTEDEHDVVVDWGDGSDEETFTVAVGARSTQISHTYSLPGTYDVTVTVSDDGGGDAEDTFQVEATRDPSDGPVVTAVRVGGADWTPLFRDFVDPELGIGYAIPLGSDDQLATLPWGNIDQIAITFDSDVDVTVEDLRVFGVNSTSYTDLIERFDYAAGSKTAIWGFGQHFATDKLLISLSDRVTNSEGFKLDGEWIDTELVESGDGKEGGDFEFRLNVLPGDADQSGVVNGGDIGTARVRRNAIAGFSLRYDPEQDLDGSGVVNGGDIGVARLNRSMLLPVGEPAATRSAARTADVFFANLASPGSSNRNQAAAEPPIDVFEETLAKVRQLRYSSRRSRVR